MISSTSELKKKIQKKETFATFKSRKDEMLFMPYKGSF